MQLPLELSSQLSHSVEYKLRISRSLCHQSKVSLLVRQCSSIISNVDHSHVEVAYTMEPGLENDSESEKVVSICIVS